MAAQGIGAEKHGAARPLIPRRRLRLGEESTLDFSSRSPQQSLWRSCCSQHARDASNLGHEVRSLGDEVIHFTDQAKETETERAMDPISLEGFASYASEHLGAVLRELASAYELEASSQRHPKESSLMNDGSCLEADDLEDEDDNKDTSRDTPEGISEPVPSETHLRRVSEESSQEGGGLSIATGLSVGVDSGARSVLEVGGRRFSEGISETNNELATNGSSGDRPAGVLERMDSPDRRPGNELPKWVRTALRSTMEMCVQETTESRWSWSNMWKRVTFQNKESAGRSKSLESVQRAIRRGLRKRTEVQRLVQVDERLFAALTLLNAVFVGFELQYFVTREDEPSAIRIISAGFTTIFTLELLIRLARRGWRLKLFLTVRWNILDTLVVACLWGEQVIRWSLSRSDMPEWVLWDVSLVRVFRFAELIHRLTMVTPFLREIRLLIKVTYVAARSWFWIIGFSSMLVFFSSTLMAHGTYTLCKDDVIDISREEMCKHFGTFSKTFLTLYKAILGGLLWGELMEALKEAPIGYQIIFVLYVSFGVLVIANLAAGVLIEVHADGRRTDLECLMSEEERRCSLFIRTMKAVFLEMDANSSGAVSKEELELAMEDPWMLALLRCYNLDIHDAHLLFELMDSDASGFIDIEEFISGCLKLQGSAKATDIMRLQVQVETLTEHLGGAVAPTSTTSPGLMASKQSSRLREIAAARSIVSTFTSSPSLPAGSGFPQPSESMRPTWVGGRIPKVEERAMRVSELRTLSNQVRMFISDWVRIDSNTKADLSTVNMYDVNYNWICPLTVPDGVILRGLSVDDLCLGNIVTQERGPSHDSGGTDSLTPRGVGEVIQIDVNGAITVKVLKGRFTVSDGPIHVASLPCGVPQEVFIQNAMSYKELVSASPTRPDWYCCHWWGEPLVDFITCVEEHCKLRALQAETAYWVCAFANSQHDLGMELTDDPTTSSFHRALQMAVGVLLVLDSQATPFQRIWCDYELYKTVLDSKRRLDIATVRKTEGRRSKRAHILAELKGESAVRKTTREATFPISVLAKGINAKLEEGRASVQADKLRILAIMQKGVDRRASGNNIEQDFDEVEVANQTLNAYFAWAAWPQALKKGIVRRFCEEEGSEVAGWIDLPRITSQEQSRRKLQLSLAHFVEVTDSAIADLCAGLPPNLMELSLSFEGCSHITDKGLSHIGHALHRRPKMQHLQLDFLGCKRISDLGLESLAKGLPTDLQKLRLDLAMCHHVTPTGVHSLASFLPSGLKTCSCTLKGTGVDCNFDSLDELRSFTRSSALGSSPGRWLQSSISASVVSRSARL